MAYNLNATRQYATISYKFGVELASKRQLASTYTVNAWRGVVVHAK